LWRCASPCYRGAAHRVDLSAFREGQHQLQAIIKDAAGNTTTAGPRTITIDRTAPGPPGGLTVLGGDVSRATNSFDVSWTNADGQAAPITRAHYRICPAFGGACTPEATAGGDNITSLTGLQVPGQGAWTLTVWLEDAAGNSTSVFATQFPKLNAEGAPSTPAGIQRILNGKLKVWFAKTRNTRFTSRYGQRVVTRGRLLDSRGKPIRGARIDVFHRLRSSGHRRLLKTGLKTRADGRITLILPLNIDTRGVEYDFRAVRPGKITSRQILRLTVKRHGRTFIRQLKTRT